MMRHTGGCAVGEISTRSRFLSRAILSASKGGRIPTCLPSSSITRISRARIRSFVRIKRLSIQTSVHVQRHGIKKYSMPALSFSSQHLAEQGPVSDFADGRRLLNRHLPAIPDEAFMDKFRGKAPDYIFWNVVLFQFFKLELDRARRRAFGIYGCDHVAVNVRLGSFGIPCVLGQRIALGASRSDDPAREDASIRSPIIRVVSAV